VIDVRVGTAAATVRPLVRVTEAAPPDALCAYVTSRVPSVAADPVVTWMVQEVSEVHA